MEGEGKGEEGGGREREEGKREGEGKGGWCPPPHDLFARRIPLALSKVPIGVSVAGSIAVKLLGDELSSTLTFSQHVTNIVHENYCLLQTLLADFKTLSYIPSYL